MSKVNQPALISEHILEVRFKPNPKILDVLGTWTELFAIELALPEWTVLENRIDIFDSNNVERVFVGFRNAGYICYDVPTQNFFPDRAIKFLKYLISLEGFENPLTVERLGVRSKFVSQYQKAFDELRDRYTTRYLTLTDKAKELIGAKLIDTGGALNFVDALGNFNTRSGPIAETQMKQWIGRPKEGEYPDVGLYFDIDYWIKPNKKMEGQEIFQLIKSYAIEGWSKHERIHNLICGD